MKILQVHNEYQQAGGEDVVVKAEYDLLCESHEISQFIMTNQSINTLRQKMNVAFTTHYSNRSYKIIKKILQRDRPDVVHVHNFFPLISPSVFQACKEMGIPSIMTLHNYRLINPSGLLINGDTIDERSIRRSAYKCVPDKVYRNSILQTFVVAHMIEFHRRRKTWHNLVDTFIALTDFAKKKFIEGGLPGDKIIVKPNFIDNLSIPYSVEKQQFVFVGRLSSEKGILTLLKSWESVVSHNLIIIGDGPLRDEVEKAANNNPLIEWKGKRSSKDVLHFISNSKALIFPSEWYEGFPMVILEAFSLGVPVITSDIGSQKEIISDGKTGLHFRMRDPDSLVEKVNLISKNRKLRSSLSTNCRNEYLSHYTPEINMKELIAIYEAAIDKERK